MRSRKAGYKVRGDAIPLKDWTRFIEEVPYIESPSNFGLGNSLGDAGKIVRRLAEMREMEESNDTPQP